MTEAPFARAEISAVGTELLALGRVDTNSGVIAGRLRQLGIDVVARSIVREENETGGGVFLTLAHLDPVFVVGRFPTIAEMCRRVGLDLARDAIPVGPAAHYIMGGVETDGWGRTSLEGLFAAGEVACTGVHGANRLASNSLLEGLVFGGRAGDAMIRDGNTDRWRDDVDRPIASAAPESPATTSVSLISGISREELAELMWQRAGVFRDGPGLTAALQQLGSDGGQTGVRPGSDATLVTVARLIVRAALRREESRGSHYRRDFPARDDLNWRRRLTDTRPGVPLV